MASWWKKPEPPQTEVVEQIEAIEVPVVTEVKRRLAKGEVVDAIRYSYPKAAEDLARAFKQPFPPGMTHEEFLRRGSRSEMGHLPEFFRRFYEWYSPLRYGPTATTDVDSEALLGMLGSIYTHRAMWYLYLQSTEEGVVTVKSRTTVRPAPGPEAPPTPDDEGGPSPPAEPEPAGADDA